MASFATAAGEGSDGGLSWVVFGKRSGFPQSLDLASLDGTNGFKIKGEAASDLAAIVSAAGDVNGDGFDDLLIGAPGADANGSNTGAAYVLFGKGAAFPAEVSLSSLNGATGFKISGVAPFEGYLMNVAAAGDINGDGFDDVIIGAPRASTDGQDRGAAYVIFGKGSGFIANLQLSSLDGTSGFKIVGSASLDDFGVWISGAGDLNGDGFDDIVIVAPRADVSASDSGAAYVVFGKASGFTARLDVSSLNGANGFRISGAGAGSRVGEGSGVADFNGDGFDDILVGAEAAEMPNSSTSSTTYLIFGKATGFSSDLDLTALEPSHGLKIRGVQTFPPPSHPTPTVTRVAGAGDLNGDGFADLIFSVPFAAGDGRNSGAGYVVFGTSDSFPGGIQLSSLDGSNGFTIYGLSDRNLLQFGRAAGDINGDGFDDLLLLLRSNRVVSSTSAQLIFGKASTPLPEISVSDVSVLEGDSETVVANFTVSLSGASDETVVVSYSTQNGTASAPSDYTAVSNQLLQFAPGETSKTISISVRGDTVIEANETFFVDLASPTGALLAKARGIGTILNDDLPSLSISDVTVDEGDSGITTAAFTVLLSVPAFEPVSVRYSTQSGTATTGSDFAEVLDQVLEFAPGETSKVIHVSVLGDTMVEQNETFSVQLSQPVNATVQRGTGTGTIRNDDRPEISVSDLAVLEGNSGETQAIFTVTLSQPTFELVSVRFSTSDGTATAGPDYTAISGALLQFEPGETTKPIAVNVLGDTVVERDETFTVTLSEVINATLVGAEAIGTILNDDQPQISISNAVVAEGNSGSVDALFTVTLDQPSHEVVTVRYSTSDGSAFAGSDYTPAADGVLEFSPGETSRTIAVGISGDRAVEADEVFFVNLFSAENATPEQAQGIGTILNDDREVVISATGTRLVFTDIDGDRVKITTTRGTFTEETLDFDADGRVLAINLATAPAGSSFAGAKLNIAAKAVDGGDGRVSIGVLNAAGLNLKTISIVGDLGAIHIGQGIPAKPALKSLFVDSMSSGGTSLIDGTVGLVKIRGDLTGTMTISGGFADETAAAGALAATKFVVGNLDGSGGGAEAGALRLFGSAETIVVKGDVIGGAQESGVFVGGKIGSLKIGGNLRSADDGHRVTISALGDLAATKPRDALALASLSIGGGIVNADVLAGYSIDRTPLNPRAGIGSIFIGGIWATSSVAAGMADITGDGFGRNDAPIGGELPAGLLARIASITLKGPVFGSNGSADDHYGITAQQIGMMTIGKTPRVFTAGANDFLLDPLNNDFRAVDLA